MGVTSAFIEFWGWLISSTYNLLSTFVLPGTTYTVLGLFVELLLVVFVIKLVSYWLGTKNGDNGGDSKASSKYRR